MDILFLNIRGFENLIFNDYLKDCNDSPGNDDTNNNNINNNKRNCDFKNFKFLNLNEAEKGEDVIIINAF